MPGSDGESSVKQPGLDELITIDKAAQIAGFSEGHVRLLLRHRELWGVKLGRTWLTTAVAVRDYLARDRLGLQSSGPIRS